jgi:hypothetical protein
MQRLDIKIKPGNVAPRYTTEKQLTLDGAVITEQGMDSGLPLVDLTFTDADGNKYFTMTSGRILNALAIAIRGVNMRVHGKENT